MESIPLFLSSQSVLYVFSGAAALAQLGNAAPEDTMCIYSKDSHYIYQIYVVAKSDNILK